MFCSTFFYWTAVYDPGKLFHPLCILQMFYCATSCRDPSVRLVKSDGSRSAGDIDAWRSGYRWTSRANGSRFVLHGWSRVRILDLFLGLLPGRRNGSAVESRNLSAFGLAEAGKDHRRLLWGDFLCGNRAHLSLLLLQGPVSDSQEAFR